MVLGGIIYYIVMVIVLWLKLPSNDLKLFTAMVVAIFLAVPYLQAKSSSSFAKAAQSRREREAQEGCLSCIRSPRPSTPGPSTRKRP